MIFLSGQFGIEQAGFLAMGPCFMDQPSVAGGTPSLLGGAAESARGEAERLKALESGGGFSGRPADLADFAKKFGLAVWDERLAYGTRVILSFPVDGPRSARRFLQQSALYKGALTEKYHAILGQLARLSLQMGNKKLAMAIPKGEAEQLWKILFLDLCSTVASSKWMVEFLRAEVRISVQPAVEKAWNFWKQYFPELEAEFQKINWGDKNVQSDGAKSLPESSATDLEAIHSGPVVREVTAGFLAWLVRDNGGNLKKVVKILERMKEKGEIHEALSQSEIQRRISRATPDDPLSKLQTHHAKRAKITMSLIAGVLKQNSGEYAAAARALHAMGYDINEAGVAQLARKYDVKKK